MGRRNDGSFQIYFTDLVKGGRSTVELENAVKALLPERPGFTYRYGHHGGGGGGDVLEIDLAGERMELLQMYAENVRSLLRDLPGVDNIDLSTERGEQEVRVMVDRDRAATSGISTQQVAMTLSSQLGNRPAGRFKAAEREIDINMRLDRKDRLNLTRLETLELYGQGGQMRDLKNLAAIELGRGPRNIEKNDRLYTVEVYVPIRGGGIYRLSNDVMQRLSGLKMAPGYSWSLGRNYQSMIETEQDSRFAIVLSLILIYILLAALFESFIHPFTILLSVPFAMLGVAMIFLATKTNLSGISYIGVIIVCGLVVNNGIILVDYINQLRAQGLARRDAIVTAVQKRLRPILMTASTTVLSLLPMCAPLISPSLFGPAEGRAAMWGPVGLAILGGMTTSTFLTLIITPTLYSLIDDLAQGGKALAMKVFSLKRPV